VRTTPTAPRAARPLALGFTADGNYLLVALAGQNAIEVRTAGGDAIPRFVPVEFIIRRSPVVHGAPCDTPANRTIGGSRRSTPAPPSCRFRPLRVPHTYIPAGWYPSALASAAHPDTSASTRLYVTNVKGIGAGPGENGQAVPLIGERTQGVLQAIDLPTDATAQNAALDQWTATVVENNNWGTLFKRTRRDAATNPCRRAPLPDDTSAFSKFLCKESKKRGPSPYHVFYVVKENKTFDAFFGDLPTPGFDASTTFLLFGESDGTKNQHNLARTFTLGDNFWADSEQSTTGHKWTSAGFANEYVEITWNPEYSEGLRGDRGSGRYENGSCPGVTCQSGCGCLTNGAIGAEEGELNEPEERLVDLLANPITNPRGVTFRIYSDDVNHDSPAQAQKVPLDLWGFKTTFLGHGRDLDFPDTDRATLFLTGHTVSHAWSEGPGDCIPGPCPPPPSYCKEVGFCGAPDDAGVADFPDAGFCARSGAASGEYEKFSLAAWVQQYNDCVAAGGSDDQCQAAMPNLIYMALPVDHTLGFNPGSPEPNSMVADNDNATGLIVQELSKTPFWKNTLVMITEDDTQLTGDHVDAHRTFLLTAGGLSRQHGAQGSASHQASSFPSILKTIEVLFAVPSLAIYDRAAVPLHDFVVAKATDRLTTPGYTKEDPGIAFAGSNGCTAPPMNASTGTLARLSRKVDWRLDRGDPELVTAIMYAGLRGWPLPEKYQKLAEE